MGPVSDGKADHVVVEEVGVIVAEIVLLAACFIGAIIWLWCILFMAKMNAFGDEIVWKHWNQMICTPKVVR